MIHRPAAYSTMSTSSSVGGNDQASFPYFYNATVLVSDQIITKEEKEMLQERRAQIQGYEPPYSESESLDPVSGEQTRIPMSNKANIVFIGPTGSGKSSLIGSLYRAVNGMECFPERVRQTLNHPDDSGHGTLHWLENPLNQKGNIHLQDTRGDQTFDDEERSLHDRALRGFYRDQTLMKGASMFSGDWWRQKWFWQRSSLSDCPHSVVFVFDGSAEPFLVGESLRHYKELFQMCSDYGYEPVVVITCADLMHQQAQERGENFEVKKNRKLDKVLFEFERQNLTRQSIYLVTNFHEGRRGRRMWTEEDEGFDVASKIMVDLARDLLNVANRFIRNKYNLARGHCTVL